jgi:hypothetical protein
MSRLLWQFLLALAQLLMQALDSVVERVGRLTACLVVGCVAEGFKAATACRGTTPCLSASNTMLTKHVGALPNVGFDHGPCSSPTL